MKKSTSGSVASGDTSSGDGVLVGGGRSISREVGVVTYPEVVSGVVGEGTRSRMPVKSAVVISEYKSVVGVPRVDKSSGVVCEAAEGASITILKQKESIIIQNHPNFQKKR